MKFFMPHPAAKGDEAAYQEVREHVARIMEQEPTGTDRYYSLRYTHNGKEYRVRVGETEEYFGDEVLAIFEVVQVFVVITRGSYLGRHNPILVGKHNILGLETFETD